MTETRVEVLFLNPSLCCPDHQDYGKECNEFFASTIFRFSGKLWQLRTVIKKDAEKKKDKYFLFPFVINTGGSAWNRPIMSDEALQCMDKAFSRTAPERAKCGIVMPTPLGDMIDPTQQVWDDDRKANTAYTKCPVKYNLVGHELAGAIDVINALVMWRRLTDDAADGPHLDPDAVLAYDLHRAAKTHAHDLHLNDGVLYTLMRREASAMSSSGSEWTEDKLPIPNSLLVT